MRTFCVIAVIVAAIFGLVGPTGDALAETCTFDNAVSGNWDASGNWSCGHVPTADDRVIVPNGETCAVNVTNAEADTVTVESTGTLNIQASKKLTLDDDDFANNTTITGTLNLQASSAELLLQDNSQTIGGSGKIVGGDSAAKITIADGKTLTNNTTIEGKLMINGGTNTQFFNGGTVNVTVAGTFAIDCNSVEDNATAAWKITGNSSSVLRFDPDSTSLASLSGDWTIENGGRLEVRSIGFLTTGSLTWKGGIIDVDASCIAQFGYSP